jgi:hypothetical protein
LLWMHAVKAVISACMTLVAVALSLACVPAVPVSAASSPQPSDFAGVFVGVTSSGGSTMVIRKVTADWIQPKVTPRGYHDARSVVYVGINDEVNALGSTDYDPQIGTRADSIGGNPVYQAFYYSGGVYACGTGACGDPPVWFRHSVEPGDHIAASITENPRSGTAPVVLTLTDTRYRRHSRPEVWRELIRDTQWIGHQPQDGVSVGAGQADGASPLADFGTVTFSRVDVNGSVVGSYIPLWGSQYNDGRGPGVLARVSPLSKSGDSFTARWRRT